MILSDNKKGMWKRTFKIFTKVKIPWFLYLLQIVLGVVSTKIALLLVPYTAEVNTANIMGRGVIIGYIVYSLLTLVVALIEDIPSMYASSLVSKNVRNGLIRKILHLPMKDFESYKSSTLIARVTNETESVHDLISSFTAFVTGLFSTSMTFSAMAGYNANLTILMLIIFAYAFLCYWLEGKLVFLGERRLKKDF